MASVTLFASPLLPATPELTATIAATSSTPIPTDYVPGTLFPALYGLPVVGQVSWGCSLEQHPSATIKLQVLKSEIGDIRNRFKKGTQHQIAGIGFSVSNYSEKLLNVRFTPSGLYEVTVVLTGKWDAPLYKRPAFLRSHGATTPTGPIFLDPDCVLGAPSPSSPPLPVPTVTIAALALRVDAAFSGSGSDWSVRIPRDAPRDAAVDWLEEARSRLRQNQCFLNLCDTSAVKAVRTSSVAVWSYQVPEIELALSGSTEHSGSYFGYGAEYANVKIEGNFSAVGLLIEEEDTQGNAALTTVPHWSLRTPTTITLESGSVDPDIPYNYTTILKTLSHNWDTSGDTKTIRRATTEDGVPILEEEWIYGFAYTSADIVNSGGYVYGDPDSYWRVVQYKHTTYLYDLTYGYALGSDTTGWRLGRFKTEDDKRLQAKKYAGDGDAINQSLYEFESIPMISITRNVLGQYRDYYKDAGTEPPAYVTYKTCLPDGSSVPNYVLDPTYAPPFLVMEEMTYSNSFRSTTIPDPESTASAITATPAITPPLQITGEESFTYLRRQIAPSSNTTSLVGTIDPIVSGGTSGTGESGSSLALGGTPVGDRYTEFRMESSAQNGEFSDKSLRETFEEHEGQPSPATRKPPIYERVCPPTTTPSPIDPNRYEYRLTTPGYTLHSPPGGSFSAPYADTTAKALLAAKTELKMQDIQQSVQITAKIPFNAQIRPMDIVSLSTGIDSYATRVVSFQNTLEIQGQINGYPLLTAPEGTSITCGLERTIPVQMHQITVPTSPPTPTLSITLVTTAGLTLGSLISPSLVTRRNY